MHKNLAKKVLEFFREHRKQFFVFGVVFLVGGSFVFTQNADAITPGDVITLGGFGTTVYQAILTAINYLLTGAIWLLGHLLGFAVQGLEIVANYGTNNEFALQQEVIQGWQIVRDVMNGFFVAILLVIAIATIIRWQPFHYRQTLPRLLIATLLVNFSRTICLLFINASTSVMRLFLNALDGAWPAFLLGLRAPAATALSSGSLNNLFGNDPGIGSLDIAQTAIATSGAAIILQLFSIIMLFFAFAAILYILIVLLVRIIVLWFLMIFSPLAFFLWGVPGRGQSYWSEWLDEFVKHVLIGPLLAFLLYLDILFFVQNTTANYGMDFLSGEQLSSGINVLGAQPRILMGYLVGLGLIFVSLEIAQKLGVRGGNFARKASVGWFLGGALKVGGSLRDKAYKYASDQDGLRYIAPLLKPWRNIQNVATGLLGRQQDDVNYGDDRLAEAAFEIARAEGGASLGRGLRTMLLSAGNQEVWKEYGIGGVAWRGLIPRIRQSWLTNYGQEKDKLENRDKARKAYESLDGDMQRVVRGMTGQKLDAHIGNLEIGAKANQLASEITKLTDDLASGTLSADEVDVAVTKLEAKNEELQAMNRSYGTENINQWATDSQDLEKFQTFRSAIGADVDGVNVGANDRIDTKMDQLMDAQVKRNDAAEKQRISKILQDRDKEAQNFLAGSRARFNQDKVEFMKKTYPADEEVGAEELASRAVSYLSPGDISKFAGTIEQAAKQDDMKKVLQALSGQAGEELTMDLEGMTKFAEWMQKGPLQMTQQQALSVVSNMQKHHEDDKQYSIMGFVKRDSVGRLRMATPEEHHKKVREKLEKKSLAQLMREGKKGAFGQEVDDKLVLNEGAKQALRKQLGQIVKILRGPDGTRIPRSVVEALNDNFSELTEEATQTVQDDLRRALNERLQ